MMRAALAFLAWALASCSTPDTTLQWRAVPESGASLAPGARVEEPHAVALPDGGIAVAWGSVREDGTADILCARAGEGGVGPPVRVNPSGGSAVAGRQVGPRLAVVPGDRGRSRLLVSWVDRGRDPSGDILVASSEDGGLSFGPPVRVNADAGLAGQEYHDIAALPGGAVTIVWLDERDAPASTPNRKQVYAAVSRDGGRSFGANRKLTDSPEGVCPCCRPGLSASARGSFHVVYRDRAGDDLVIRTRHLDPGSEDFSGPVTLSRAPWRNDGCPVDGPSVLAGSGDEVHVAWMDASEGAEALWYARSGDGGKSFRPARPLVRPAAAVVPAAGAAGHETSCCPESSEAQPGRAVLARCGAEGAPVAAWEDSAGSVWVASTGDRGAMAIRVAGSDRASARSATVAADDGGRIHVFFVEHQVADLGPEGPRGRLGHVLLMDLGDRLTLRK